MRLLFVVEVNGEPMGFTGYQTASDFWECAMDGRRCDCPPSAQPDMGWCTVKRPKWTVQMKWCVKHHCHVPPPTGDYGDVHEYGCPIGGCICEELSDVG